MRPFAYTSYSRDVIFGPGSIDRLAEALQRFGEPRLLLCASGTARRSGHVDRLAAILGERLVAVYSPVQPHVPEAQVAEALSLARERTVTALIALGGGSPIGLAKAVAHALASDEASTAATIPIVAIPTTYAGSEMTPTFGVTRYESGTPRKVTTTDPRIVPALVLYDPTLTLDLPPDLTASTGINALAHCAEALYSITANPLSTAAALEGLHLIAHALPRCYATGDDLDARAELLAGAYLAGTALAGVSMGLHHGLCHILGGTCGVPHGVANAIILPHALRFNLDATAPALARMAPALGIPTNGRDDLELATAAVERIDSLIDQLSLPRRLRDTGVRESDLPALARLALASPTVQKNPKPIRDEAQLEALLRAAW